LTISIFLDESHTSCLSASAIERKRFRRMRYGFRFRLIDDRCEVSIYMVSAHNS